MARDSLRIAGLRELQRNLERIEKTSTRKAVLRRSLKKAAQPMADLAEQYAPVLSGDLSEGIRIGTQVVNEAGRAAYARTMREGGDKAGAVSAMRDARRAAKASGQASDVQLYLGPSKDSFYGKFQEFGTVHHAPDPFLRPAFDREAQPTVERLKPILWEEIEKSVARVAARKTGG
ncbi:HK97-gp10 family putative phage morphogenesis protein [Paracoccus alkanivorans]|uniref:HK97 gp10 family phage protein n=1 Tax=Paracoccus alkanivorans TaxID=2116655 RepID=A0A3M0MIM8_9RHOB|nr:HK97-gp10 family putative phage morphogenesis protein [Paracoccus alkanivorans]RMC37498.1 hypothetical protein C9E81_01735 [Paracoccus alkanivorans]